MSSGARGAWRHPRCRAELQRAVTSKFEAALAAVDGATTAMNWRRRRSARRGPNDRRRPPSARLRPRLVVGKTPGRDRRRPRRRGRSQGHALPPRADARPRAGRPRGIDNEAVHKMRVATRRQRAAWRVFGDAFRPSGRSAIGRACARSPDGSAPSATSMSSSRPRTPTAPTCRSPSSARSSRCSARGGNTATTHACFSMRELDSPGYRRWLDDYIDFVRTEGAAVTPVGADPAAPGPRHRAVGDLGGLRRQVRGYEPSCAGPMSRRSTSCASPGSGCATRSSSSARRSGDDADPLIARVTALQDHLGLMNDANVTASMTRTFLVEHAGEPERGRERGDRPLPRRSREGGRAAAADDRRDVARRRRGAVPADARSGGRRPLTFLASSAASRGRAPAGGRATPARRDRRRGSRPRASRPRRRGHGRRRSAPAGHRRSPRRPGGGGPLGIDGEPLRRLGAGGA